MLFPFLLFPPLFEADVFRFAANCLPQKRTRFPSTASKFLLF